MAKQHKTTRVMASQVAHTFRIHQAGDRARLDQAWRLSLAKEGTPAKCGERLAQVHTAVGGKNNAVLT